MIEVRHIQGDTKFRATSGSAASACATFGLLTAGEGWAVTDTQAGRRAVRGDEVVEMRDLDLLERVAGVEIALAVECNRVACPGGWAARVRCGGVEKELGGGSMYTTATEMLWLGLAEALLSLAAPSEVVVRIPDQDVVAWCGGQQQCPYRHAIARQNVLAICENGAHRVRFEYGEPDRRLSARAEREQRAASFGFKPRRLGGEKYWGGEIHGRTVTKSL